MNLAFSPDGQLYLTHRNGVIALQDKDGDGVSESRTTILELKTPGDYPHNGLGGIAFSNEGWLYVGMGENLGAEYTLKGSDGRSHTGGGEGGNVFRCRPDGSQLQLVATGFWNPFALAVYKNGFLLAVDNDPDSRPPCRLLDVVLHGDYGYKFRYGRSGLHPFTAWNGELPGTLPMIAGTGEAPSGILVCDRARLPTDYREALLVTSWGDHRLEIFRPGPFGASLRADRETLVEGDEWFRPVAVAPAPDGSIYFTDWVDRNYSVHQKGRIWRLAAKAGVKTKPPGAARVSQNSERQRMNRLLGPGASQDELIRSLSDRDPFIRSAAIGMLAQPPHRKKLLSEIESKNPQVRLGAVLALRRLKYGDPIPLLEKLLSDSDEQIRLMTLIWAGEEKLSLLTNRLNAALSAGSVSSALLRTYTAASQILTGAKPATGLATNGVSAPLASSSAGSRGDGNQGVRFFELETKPDEGPFIELLTRPPHKDETQLRIEAVRSLAGTTGKKAGAILRVIALDRKNPMELRTEAIVSLAGQAGENTSVFAQLLDDSSAEVRIEAARALRQIGSQPEVRRALDRKLESIRNDRREAALVGQLEFALNGANGPSQPSSDAGWRQALKQPGDVPSGRRVFFQPGIGCARCHRIEDHGGSIGPDLSVITRGSDRERLMQSILHPSREIAPQFVSHIVETRSRETFSGISPGQGPDGSLTLVMADGRGVWIPMAQIASDILSEVSLMPEGLEKGMTVQDFRDLMAFLLSRR